MAKAPSHPRKSDRRQLRTRLIRRQFQFHEKRPHALVIIVAGYLSSDGEDAVDHLLDWMDPRNIRVYALDRNGRGDELVDRYRPPQGRYWRRLPARGEIAVFHGGWYGPLLRPGAPDDDSLSCLCRLEAMLQAEGVKVLKIWLDRPAKDVRQRLKTLQADTATAWRVSAQDRAVLKQLPAYRRQVDRVLAQTACDGGAPWHRLELDHSPARWEDLAALTLDALKPGRFQPATAPRRVAPPRVQPLRPPPPDNGIKKQDYESQLAHWQGRLRRLTASAAFAKRSLVIVFEGYDAAGKGGAIRRLSRGIDPAQLAVVPIAAPTAEDRLYPYLWRFWRHIPPYHEVTIFDRSWYGRVLVERVEGFARRADWQRAYGEIRDFEHELTAHGVVLVKIWLDVSAEEQRQRFAARGKTPYKQYKLTPADLKNAELRPAYEKAVAEMFARTHTAQAPWAVIAADDKRFARIAVLRHVVETLTAALEK